MRLYQINENVILTITFVFIIVSDHSIRAITNPIRIRFDTLAIEHRIFSGTFDAAGWRRTITTVAW